MRRLLPALLMLLLLGAHPSAPAFAAQTDNPCVPPPLDLVLVLDDSGSMVEDGEANDPHHLRITASHLLVDLLAPGDRAGVVLFSHQVRSSPLSTLPDGAPGLHAAIDSFASRGGTRLDRAVQEAMQLLPPDPGRRRAILLLTDGQPDTEPEQQVALLRDLSAQARRQGISLYAIGLGPSYDRALLEELTQIADSPLTTHVRAPSDLPGAFFAIVRELKGLGVAEIGPDGTEAGSRALDVRQVSLHQAEGATPRTYQITPARGTVLPRGEVSWLVERTAFAISILEPQPRQAMPPDGHLAVRARVIACDGGPLPEHLVALALDADRLPVSEPAPLTCSGDTCTGSLQAGGGGPLVMAVMAGDGARQGGRADVTTGGGGAGEGVPGGGSGIIVPPQIQLDLRFGMMPRIAGQAIPPERGHEETPLVLTLSVEREWHISGLDALRGRPLRVRAAVTGNGPIPAEMRFPVAADGAPVRLTVNEQAGPDPDRRDLEFTVTPDGMSAPLFRPARHALLLSVAGADPVPVALTVGRIVQPWHAGALLLAGGLLFWRRHIRTRGPRWELLVRGPSGRPLRLGGQLREQEELVLDEGAAPWWPPGARLGAAMIDRTGRPVARITNLSADVPMAMEGVSWPQIFVGEEPITVDLGGVRITFCCR